MRTYKVIYEIFNQFGRIEHRDIVEVKAKGSKDVVDIVKYTSFVELVKRGEKNEK